MNEDAAREILKELFSSIGDLETRTSAIVQLMKDKGVATEEELAPYLEEASKATSVRWMAAQARMDRLISSALKTEEPEAQSSTAGAPQATSEKKEEASASDGEKETTSSSKPARQSGADGSAGPAVKNPSDQAAALKEVGASADSSNDVDSDNSKKRQPTEKNSEPHKPAVENAA